MRQSQLNRTLNLVRRTGDKLIILDKDSDDAFVLMDLDGYEKVLGLEELPTDVDDTHADNCEDCLDCEDECDDPECDCCHPKSEETDPLGDYVLDDAIDAVEKSNLETAARNLSAEQIPEIKISEPIIVAEPEPQLHPVEQNPAMGEQQANIVGEESLADVPHEEETFLLEPVE